jgi:hypothetical protein
MSRFLLLLKSKTVWGAVLGAGAWLAGQPKVGVVEVIQAVGTVVSAAGVRDAIAQK